MSTMRLSEDVEYISLHKPLPFVLQGYVWPFILLYATLLVVWVGVYGFLEYTEAFLIGFAIIGGLNIITCLFGVWSVHVRCALTCSKASSVQDASLVKVVPTPNNGFTELVNLVKQKHKLTGEQLMWFMFQKTKYLYDQKEGKFHPLEFPTSKQYSDYLKWEGYPTDMDAEAAKQLYGKNKLDVESPDFWSLFKERATAPFFVFQVFCVGLWCLDEYWYYSLFTLAMLVSFEAILVKQQQRNLSEVRKMGTKAFKMQVLRAGKWIKMSSDELLPGDIVSISRSKDDDVVPCDILLLKGQCIVDEALLTGESVPQMKEPLNSATSNEVLNLERDARLHMISGGTRIVQHTPPDKTSPGLRPKDNGCLGYVLRTSFNTNQGKLLRTILFGVKRVTANNFETFIFIMFLLVFAIMAAAYVWIKGTEDPERNRYKLFLECTLILTSVVPPELPIELSLAVNTSLIALAKLGIYCTEPFRIPFGGKVDVCCFDKTGTLTSDNLVVQGIAGLPKPAPQDKNSAHHSTPRRSAPSATTSSSAPSSTPSSTPSRSKPSISVTVAKDSSFETQCVLASCQSLAFLDGDIVGDPLEKVSVKAIDWTLDKSDTLTAPLSLGKNVTLKIIRRFHFSSALKRMSAICSVSSASSAPAYLASVKGAPEVLRDMLTSVPDDYDVTYSKLMRQGARVLALGYKHLGNVTRGQVNSMKRHHIEADLTFAGFLVIICPLKDDSKQNIRCLHDSSHHVIMLTGDNPLTACHVAKELKITQRKLLILSHVMSSNDDNDDDVMPSEEWEWQTIGGGKKAPLETDPAQLGKEFDLCVTGDGLTYLLTRGPGARAFFSRLLPYIKVFARVSPKQKELAVTTYKSLGYNTLMCGDGTNDVGALKHAHVGVALLSTIKSKKKQAEGEDGTPVDASDGGGGGKGGSSTPLVPKTEALKRRELRPQLTAHQIREKKLKELMKQMDEAEPQLVRLGDASIASPFTSRKPSISCICHVIKQGRCTLVTTLQMFKILALNALILAYSQSVLYLDGIKFSDLQATIQGFLLAGCFLFISRSKPLTTLSKERPLPNIFNLYTILTVILQFFVHFVCLVFLVRETKAIVGHSEEDIDLEKEFEQNELNSAVYLISMAMQISNFAVNYKGHPFMETLIENKPLLYSILGSAGAVLTLASGVIPELSASLQIETFTEEFRHTLIIVLLADFAMAYAVDRVLSYFLGTAKLRLPA